MKFRWKKNTRGLFPTCQVYFNENNPKTQSFRRRMASILRTNPSPLPLLPRRALTLFENKGYAPRAPSRSLGSSEEISQGALNSRGTTPVCVSRLHGAGGGLEPSPRVGQSLCPAGSRGGSDSP